MFYFLTSFYATFQCGRNNIFKKIKNKNFALENIKKRASKVAHNPTRPRVLIPAIFCFVEMRQLLQSVFFSSLKLSNFAG